MAINPQRFILSFVQS